LRIVDARETNMNLATADARLFFKLFFALRACTDRQLKITPKERHQSRIGGSPPHFKQFDHAKSAV